MPILALSITGALMGSLEPLLPPASLFPQNPFPWLNQWLKISIFIRASHFLFPQHPGDSGGPAHFSLVRSVPPVGNFLGQDLR